MFFSTGKPEWIHFFKKKLRSENPESEQKKGDFR